MCMYIYIYIYIYKVFLSNFMNRRPWGGKLSHPLWFQKHAGQFAVASRIDFIPGYVQPGLLADAEQVPASRRTTAMPLPCHGPWRPVASAFGDFLHTSMFTALTRFDAALFASTVMGPFCLVLQVGCQPAG